MKDEALTPTEIKMGKTPIPTFSSGISSDTSESAIVLAHKARVRVAASNTILDWLRHEFGLGKPSIALSQPHELDADGFAAAVRKALQNHETLRLRHRPVEAGARRDRRTCAPRRPGIPDAGAPPLQSRKRRLRPHTRGHRSDVGDRSAPHAISSKPPMKGYGGSVGGTEAPRKSLAWIFLSGNRKILLPCYHVPSSIQTGLAARDGLWERGRRQKFGKGAFSVCICCNPLKLHKTGRNLEMLGKKSLEVGRRARATLDRRSPRFAIQCGTGPPFVRQSTNLGSAEPTRRQGLCCVLPQAEKGRRPTCNIQMTAQENCGYFFPKSDCLLGSQFCLSGSVLRDERVDTTKLHRIIRRAAGRARSHAARGGGMRSRGVQNAAERGRPE